MKKFLLTSLCLVGIINVLHAQNDKPRYLKHATLLGPIDITKTYSEDGLFKGNSTIIKLKKDTSLVMVDGRDGKIEAKKISTDTILIKGILIEKDFAFDVVQQIGSFSIIKFWDLKQSTASNLLSKIKSLSNKPKIENYHELKIGRTIDSLKIKGLTAKIGEEEIDLSKTYYIVPTKTLINNSTEFVNKNGLWNIGLLVLPIKLRPFATEKGQFDFSSGVSVGPTFAWTVHHNWKTNFTHNILAYVGISSYTADATKIKETREDYKIATFSPAIGWMWEKNNVQLSFLTGIDFPSGSIQQNWVYRNKPWFGIGIGISLFKINNDETNSSGKN